MNKWLCIALASISITIKADTTSSLAHAILDLNAKQVQMLLLSSVHLSPEQTEKLLKFTDQRLEALSKVAALKDLGSGIFGAAVGCLSGYYAYQFFPSTTYLCSEFSGLKDCLFPSTDTTASAPSAAVGLSERPRLLIEAVCGAGILLGLRYLFAGLNRSATDKVQLEAQRISLMLLGKSQHQPQLS